MATQATMDNVGRQSADFNVLGAQAVEHAAGHRPWQRLRTGLQRGCSGAGGMTPDRPGRSVVKRFCGLLVLGVAGLLLTGCGSASTTRTIAVTVPTPPIPTTAASHAVAAVPASAEDKAAPSSGGSPDFVLNEQSQSGDKLKLEGRFGPLLPANESDVDQSVLGGCSGIDGRELITRLDLTATIASGLSAHVTLANLSPSAVTPRVDFVIDNAEGATCSSGDASSEEAAEEAANPNLGTLQPHEPHHFTMWVVLPDAITPDDPHPSTATLAHEQWLIRLLGARIDNSPTGVPSAQAATGRHIVTCPVEVGAYQEAYIALVSGTPQTINTSDPKNELLCSE